MRNRALPVDDSGFLSTKKTVARGPYKPLDEFVAKHDVTKHHKMT